MNFWEDSRQWGQVNYNESRETRSREGQTRSRDDLRGQVIVIQDLKKTENV